MTVRPFPAVGSAVKLRGVNLVPQADTGWSDLWSTWPWTTWVKWQIDEAAALGANAVRIIGGIGGVLDGSYTQAVYQSRFAQIADYCASLGVWFYPCFGDPPQFPPGTTDEQVLAVIEPTAAGLDPKPAILGWDILNEGGQPYDAVGAWTAAIRGYTTKPLGASRIAWNDSYFVNAGEWQAQADFCDFYDVHIWYDGGPDQSLIREWAARHADGKPMIVGEFGQKLTDAYPTRVDKFRRTRAVHEQDEIAGTFAWAISDQTTADSGSYGLVNEDGTRRYDATSLLTTYRTARLVVP